MEEKEAQERKLPIIRLKLNILPKNCKIDGVYDALKGKFRTDDNEKNDNADHSDDEDDEDDKHNHNPNHYDFKFSNEAKGTVGNMTYYITTCQCQFITSSVVHGKKDDVNGDMTFFYWEDEGIKLYAIVRSGKSKTWTLLRSYRDCQFPKQFAMKFLNPKSIKETSASYLAGKCSGTSKATYTNADKFDPSDIISNYGVIEKFKAEILTSGDGRKLKDMCNLGSTKHYNIGILTGQVNLIIRDRDTDCRFKLLEFIDASISNKDTTAEKNWRFLTYIHRVYDVKTEVSSKILKELSQMYRNGTDESPSLDLNSSLIHVHQDVFNNSNVSVLYKGDTIPWADDNKQCKGENISVKDIFHAIKKKLRLEEDPDFNAVKVCFYNTIIGEKETTQLTDFLGSQTIIENDCVFQLGKRYYTVETDTFLDTTTRFANAVSNTIVSNEEKQNKPFPQIIPWCTKNGDILPSFEIETLLRYAMIDKEQIVSNEMNDKLSKLLTTGTSLLRPLDSGDLGKSTNDLLRSKIKEISTDHDIDLLDVNLSLLPETVLAKSILKAAKKREGFLNEIRDILIDSPDEVEILSKMKKVVKVTDNKDIFKNIIKELKKKEPCLVRDELDKNRYSVNSPYITKYLWEQIEQTGLRLCPSRLIQFLRRHIPMDEEYYNELYRLSNCKCEKSEWKYIVGDQILDMDSDRVELFDVMAYNKSKKIAYLLHVKKDFQADAFRAACSQVRVSGDEVWKSVTVNSKTNAFDKFFTCASKESRSFRKNLTKKEVERYIAPTNEAFIDVMLDCGMQFYICLATCLAKGKNLTQVSHCNLNYKFGKTNFPACRGKTLERLIDIGMIDKKFFTITGKCFGTKEQFIRRVHSEKASISKTWAEKACNEIFLKTCEGRDSLLVSGSFVAKVSLIDLHRLFSDYTVHGKSRVKLTILEIDDISGKKEIAKEPRHTKTTTTKKTSIFSKAKPVNPVKVNKSVTSGPTSLAAAEYGSNTTGLDPNSIKLGKKRKPAETDDKLGESSGSLTDQSCVANPRTSKKLKVKQAE